MVCRIEKLRCKEVINVCTSQRLGFVYDVEADVSTGQILALVIPGPCRFFGLFGREDDYCIPWDKISRIGEDIILIDVPGELRREKRRKRPWS